MNKKLLLLLIVILTICTVISGCGNPETTSKQSDSAASEVSTSIYKDGNYEGQSVMTSEGYYGKAKITVKGGLIKDIDFQIYDKVYFKIALPSDKKKDMEEMVLDDTYSKEVYANQKVYQEQCTNEFAGIKQYKDKLVNEQDVEKVDVISGATWSHKIFKEAAANALKKAENK